MRSPLQLMKAKKVSKHILGEISAMKKWGKLLVPLFANGKIRHKDV